ncbi:hypothetical protein L226DRAFT_91975 [Lentinus tigrinus ALCF2SS1-7]|uniref:uncharacterized protein n=1 Tax=Lentinus tigrinus ALCF2SS1-7 TaxID=1328758 RepID=UPI001165F222|nr:hypothetical protein L226DRAFT_91975 [Lentinus tigrinus ALCF2SS1-7]
MPNVVLCCSVAVVGAFSSSGDITPSRCGVVTRLGACSIATDHFPFLAHRASQTTPQTSFHGNMRTSLHRCQTGLIGVLRPSLIYSGICSAL